MTALDRFGLVSGVGGATTLRMLQVSELRRPRDFPMNSSSIGDLAGIEFASSATPFARR
jgi:hypothetical protein